MPRFSLTPVRGQILICLVLAVATLLPYVQVAGHDFITFDDNMYVYENPDPAFFFRKFQIFLHMEGFY